MVAVNPIDVVVRCRNEMPYAERALESLNAQQGLAVRLLVIDCHSDDGSREAAVRAGATIRDLDPANYIPGAVLNFGMEETRSELVAFINADAVALDPDALSELIAPLQRDPTVGATYGRQIARPDADRMTQLDYERAFPPSGELQTRFGEFFSMAASAVRRDAWWHLPFDSSLRYSEDVDWSHRLRAIGWNVEYVPSARFEHSHAYDLRGHFKRRSGEGTADRVIYRLGPASLVRDFARPLAGSVLRDLRAGAVGPRALATRAVQAAGYYNGRRRASWGDV
jgi:rhamnosyltransferase